MLDSRRLDIEIEQAVDLDLDSIPDLDISNAPDLDINKPRTHKEQELEHEIDNGWDFSR